MTQARSQFYLDQVRLQLPRLLSHYDLDPTSPTFGCGDRDHWGWKTKDFGNAALQGGACTLAILLADHQWEPSAALLDTMESILLGAVRMVRSDGSVDEAFPYESSWCATATLAFQFGRVLELCGNRLSHAARVREARGRMTNYIASRRETHGVITNHLATAAAALVLDGRHEKALEDLIESVLKNQSPEGWFQEYDGADPGYQTLCMYYLAELFRLRPSDRLRDALARSLEFLSYCVHPDGTLGGEYGSRNTEVAYPAGFELLAREFPLAAAIADRIGQACIHENSVTLGAVDAGNFMVLLENYARAATNVNPGGSLRLPCEEADVERFFPQAGIHIRGTGSYYAIINARKGGAGKVFDRRSGGLLWNDGGYVGTTSRRQLVSTQMIDTLRNPEHTRNRLLVRGPFYLAHHRQMTPSLLLRLRLLNLSLMRLIVFREFVKKRMVKLLITGRTTLPAHVEREYTFSPDRILVRDRIVITGRLKFEELQYGIKFSSIHMASAKYFHRQILEKRFQPRGVDIDRLNREKTIVVETVIQP